MMIMIKVLEKFFNFKYLLVLCDLYKGGQNDNSTTAKL